MAIIHQFYPILEVFKELVRGRSLARAYLHLTLEQFHVYGKVLDIGSKHSEASYWKYIKRAADTQIVATDLVERAGVVRLNVEETFDLPSSSFDHVVGLNLFEHVGSFAKAPEEIARVVKPRGLTIIATPFLYPYHADPHDYFRFTDEGLQRVFETTENRVVHVQALGEGVLTLGLELILRAILPSKVASIFFSLLYPVLSICDRVLRARQKVSERTIAERYPSAILIVLRRLGNE